jgi:hypothetical protein
MNTAYEVSMSPAIESETGIQAFEVGMNYLFKTVATAPSVTTKTPAAGATGVPVTQSVTAVFDKEMDSSTITSATFYIIKQGGSPLPASVTYNAATKTATLDPCPFTDVVAQSGIDPFYPSKFVAVCAAHGVTTGKPPTTFVPYETITQQPLISMVVRAATLSSPPASFTPNFAPDQFSLNDHYLNARKAAYAGLLGIGPGYQFMGGSTRGECAQLLCNLTILLGS